MKFQRHRLIKTNCMYIDLFKGSKIIVGYACQCELWQTHSNKDVKYSEAVEQWFDDHIHGLPTVTWNALNFITSY